MSGSNIGTVDAIELVTVGQRKDQTWSSVGRSYAVAVDIQSRELRPVARIFYRLEVGSLLDWARARRPPAVQTAHGDPVLRERR